MRVLYKGIFKTRDWHTPHEEDGCCFHTNAHDQDQKQKMEGRTFIVTTFNLAVIFARLIQIKGQLKKKVADLCFPPSSTSCHTLTSVSCFNDHIRFIHKR